MDSTVYDCSYRRLTCLPPLPVTLTQLKCVGNQLTNLPDFTYGAITLTALHCRTNQLISLPNLPVTLTELYCGRNQLTGLPHLPVGLASLCCAGNQLTSLPHLPVTLIQLSCSCNQLTSLPDLPVTLTSLWCYGNQLTSLPDLPVSLTILDCSVNQLISLPYFTYGAATLAELSCAHNRLISLPSLPMTLTELSCHDNQLTSLPISLIYCQQLTYLDYSNNPIEQTSPVLQRFLQEYEQRRRRTNKTSVYTDSQSVHNSTVQESIRQSLLKLLDDAGKATPELSDIIPDILADDQLSADCKNSLLEYASDNTCHSWLRVTFAEALVVVWERIVAHPQVGEIKAVLNQEMSDSLCKCFTGRISRLVNCLTGFDPDVMVQISSAEQISNIVLLTQKQLGEQYTAEKHRQLVREALVERGYPVDIITVWVDNIE